MKATKMTILADNTYEAQALAVDLEDFTDELELLWQELGQDDLRGEFSEDYSILHWEASLNAAVDLETRLIPSTFTKLATCMQKANQAYVQILTGV